MRLGLALAASLLALAAACKSPEERLVDRRHELRERLGDLYEDYGEEVEAAKAGAAEGERGAGGFVGRLFAEMDRSHFEEACLAVGRGERPFLLSGKLAAFLDDHARDCRDAFELQTEIAKLEREVERP
jgi:hypothetical protein